MIKLININKYYTSSQGAFHALKDINLELPDQGMVYIVGKSGSGKSTLLNVIGGIDKYDSGQLIIDNTVINNDETITTDSIDTANFKRSDYNGYRNSYIGFIFQEFNVIKGLTVYENIALSLELQKIPVKENHQKILDIIAKVGLAGKEKRRINELSGGERQRVAIARALIKDPKVIIADEPTGNLDSKNRDIVMNILKDLSKEKLVLIVTHDNNLSKLYGDRLIKIKDGEITSDEIIHQENVKNIVPTKHKIEPLSPKALVSLNLAWKGFKLNKLRFIFIIILFSVSLIFAGSVINLYLTDTTKEYALFQQEYGNFALSISDKHNYHNEITTSAFFTYDFDKTKKLFQIDENTSMKTYKNMNINIPIDRNLSETDEIDGTYRKSIQNITVYQDLKELQNGFKILQRDYTNQSVYCCYITDYLADNLIATKYFNDTTTIKDVLGKKLTVPGMSKEIVIEGIIQTNYADFYPWSSIKNDIKKQAAFEDNLAIYNSLFVSAENYKKIYSSSNLDYYYDDIIYYDKEETTKFENIKFSKIMPNKTKLYAKEGVVNGQFPVKPQKGEITQVGVSKGFIEKVLGLNPDALSWAGSSTKKLTMGSSVAYNFYLCGSSHIPTSMEFNITCVIDDDDIVVYAPETSNSSLYNNWINMEFIEGGYLTIQISDDAEINSAIYRNLLDNGISINNPSFTKLQLVDNFINDNIFLFAALFFVFCLFSTLMIFNFIIINIKNSTRDIGIYMSLGMNGFKISLIYLFQVLIISSIAMVVGIVGSTIMLSIIDGSFASRVVVDFDILHNTFYGIFGIILLSYLTPIIAIASPLISLSNRKPIDVIKVS
jgi:ABC-type lipoprotein export system ATPase subunit